MTDATIGLDLTRAGCLDFDARVLALAAAAAETLDPAVLARAARCVGWDFDPATTGESQRHAASLYDRAGTELTTFYLALGARAEPPTPPAAPAGWSVLDAPWAAISAPPGFVGGEPERDGPAAVAALQARGADWAAWADEWFTPAAGMYVGSNGQLAALLFFADAGATTLDDAACGLLVRQELDKPHRDITLEWRTDDLTRRMGAQGSRVESVVYGVVAGRPGSRIVAETPSAFNRGPRQVHIAQYVFMAPPHSCSLSFTLPAAGPERLGEADRMAATFVYRG